MDEEIFCLLVFMMDNVIHWDNYVDLDKEQPGSLVDCSSKSDDESVDENIFQCHNYQSDPGDEFSLWLSMETVLPRRFDLMSLDHMHVEAHGGPDRNRIVDSEIIL